MVPFDIHEPSHCNRLPKTTIPHHHTHARSLLTMDHQAIPCTHSRWNRTHFLSSSGELTIIIKESVLVLKHTSTLCSAKWETFHNRYQSFKRPHISIWRLSNDSKPNVEAKKLRKAPKSTLELGDSNSRHTRLNRRIHAIRMQASNRPYAGSRSNKSPHAGTATFKVFRKERASSDESAATSEAISNMASKQQISEC